MDYYYLLMVQKAKCLSCYLFVTSVTLFKLLWIYIFSQDE